MSEKEDADEDAFTVVNVIIEACLGGSLGVEESRWWVVVVVGWRGRRGWRGLSKKKWKEYTQCKQVCSVIPCMSNVELIRSAGP